MANTYGYTLTSTHGKFWQQATSSMQQADDNLKQHYLNMTQMLDGDGSQDSHYVTMAAACGFATSAIARAAYAELGSCYAKTSGDGSVSSVRAARDQFMARFRQ